ncbi:type I secretion outer membrane protein, TolC family [Anaerohalosphaera lusitana]|uniref:Type I secretion outer membrane protein, TolC family n=1 Tax=Anaerohalosphaera lusitana TaxID=1936003 RepID=A0A1U9NNE2_9BACT|nr:TolC family protein [Anaerohalosphaera lusitana]AQT69423.1 type I secretion outer membrane protein, TolC family [Anaerohalosphaera lusitana]
MSNLCRSVRSISLFALVGLLVFSFGCKTPDEYKSEADEDVYKILNNKWQERFGYKANYRISDGEPNQIDVVSRIPESGVLSQASAVEMATNFNRSYQTQKESLYLSALDLTLTRYQYATQWFGTVDAFYENTPADESTTIESSGGVRRDFLLGDGILIGTSLTADWFRYLTGDPQTSLGSVLSASLAAPLIGNGAGRIARENLTQAERNVLYNIRSFNRFRKDFVVSVISEYYRVLLQKNRVEIQQASYQRLVDSTNQLRMEVEVGQRPAYDLAEAEQRLLSAEQNVVSAVQNYEQALDNFKITLALPTDVDVELDPDELTALQDIGVSEPEYSAEEAIKTAQELRLDLSNVRDRLDDSERKLILAADGLVTQVDLVASADVDSTPDTEITRLRFHDGAYSAGITANLPLDRRAERNDYREALINVQRQQRDYDEEVDRVKLQVRDAYRELVQTAESYRIQKMGLELAEKRVQVEKLSLQYGRGTVRLLLDSEDALVQAQDDVLNALVDHMIAKLSFFRDVGILRVKPDGMWEQDR